jgi:hypothetical protein
MFANIVELLPNPSAGMGQVIDAQITDESVWRVVARTALADLLDVPGREQAWSIIPASCTPSIAKATARSWLLRFEEERADPSELEPPLAIAVDAEVRARGYLVQVLQRTPAAIPLYLKNFGFASEQEAESFLADLRQSGYILSDSVARALGALFVENRWAYAAGKAALHLRDRPDFRPLVKECFNLLGIIDRLWVGYQLELPVHLLPDEAWTAFESEAISLYPWGPSERELWSRSGGRNEELDSEENGRTKWHRCIKDLRSGKAPSVHALLMVMLDDFPFNDTLKQLTRQNFRR